MTDPSGLRATGCYSGGGKPCGCSRPPSPSLVRPVPVDPSIWTKIGTGVVVAVEVLGTAAIPIMAMPFLLSGDTRQLTEKEKEEKRKAFCTGCTAVPKALTQYKRIYEKSGKKMDPKRVKELDSKRDAGTITVEDIPASDERPGGWEGVPLSKIREVCRAEKCKVH
jgi:hypothetical protein